MRETDSANLRLATAIAFGAILAYLLLLAQLWMRGGWILDPHGAPLVTDFLPVYVAGKLALKGQAAIAYDWRVFHTEQVRFIGHSFSGYLGWPYPPLHFPTAMALAYLSYPVAFLAWTGATLLAFAAVAGKVIRHGAIFALALPPVLACIIVGQNGFFTAALLGTMLLCLPGRPLLAGVLLAALVYKPQFGILLPFALIAGGYWRTIFIALLLSLAWIGIGYAVAPATFAGFLHSLPQTSHAVLSQGTTGWAKLQSVLALAHVLGAGDRLAWALQIAVMLATAGFCIWLWRRDAPFARKAAMLSAAVPLATPYIFAYDLPLLAVPLLFLARDRAFDRTEKILVILLIAALLGLFLEPMPLGILASLLTAAMAIRRAI